MNLNKALILGRLTRNPEQRSLPSGKDVSNFGIATNRVWTDRESGEKKEQVEFHNVVAFGKLAEICNQYLNKGQLILIEGRIQTRSWEDQNGNKRTRTEIIAENMQMGPKAGGGNKQTDNNQKEPNIPVEDIDADTKKKAKKDDKTKKSNKSEQENEEIDVEDIPF